MLPAGHVEDPAADVRLQAHDARPGIVRAARNFRQFRDRHAELGARPGGAHVRVMAAADPAVDAHEDLVGAEQLRPAGEHVAVVDRDAHPRAERPGDFRAWREVRRVQNALSVEIGKQLEDPLDFTARHAFELDALGAQRAQQLRVRIGLHRVVHPRERAECAQRAGGRAHRLQVVHEGRLMLPERLQQLRALGAPPRHAAAGRVPRLREQLLPGGTEHLVARHRADEQLVQLLHQAVPLVLIDHEGEIQVVGGLAHQVDLLFLEELEGASQLVQDGADVAAHEAHRGARSDHLHAAQPRQVGDEGGEPRVVE